jgi:threonine dehydratase
MISLKDFNAAAANVAGRVRRTPLMCADNLRQDPAPGAELYLKLENLQPTGSFKVRGASNALMSLSEEEISRGLITASGGNHGLAVAYAAAMAKVPGVVFVPTSTPEAKVAKIRDWGVEVAIEGAVWDEANAPALARAEASGMTYIHPFADARVIAGQGTVALEILADNPDIDTLIVAIGGGGLIAGVATAAKQLKPSIKVIGVEPTGAPTHHASRAAGEVVTLEKIETSVGTLAPRRSDPLNFDLISQHVDDIVLVTDDQMRDAAKWLWSELGIGAELSGAASVAALMAGKISAKAGEQICPIICGAGTDGLG